MKSLTKINIITLVVLSFCLSVVGVLLTSKQASAYTCQYSNDGGSRYRSEMGYEGELQYLNGYCYIMKPDTANGGVPPNSRNQCPSDKPLMWEGQCYQERKEFTNLKPTKEDGSAVDIKDWDALCKQSGFEKYKEDRHRCDNGKVDCVWMAWDPDSIDGNCQAPGNETKTLDEVAGEDETVAKVQECTGAGRTWNVQTKDCNWDARSCPAKGGGNGVWDSASGTCKQYSDFTNREDCEKIGGEFKQNPDNPSHFECSKPNKDPFAEDDPKQHVDEPASQEKFGNCGDADTVLIGCDDSECDDGAEVIGCVLKYAINALTFIIGVAAVGGIAWNAMQYARARDNQQMVSDARTNILQIVIGLAAYVFMIAIINWLVPGGVIGN